MRLWTIHPRYLDRQGLLAVWREGLLALHVLQGRTKGYRHHPQLQRFRDTRDPVLSISVYLDHIHPESVARGYKFDSTKIPSHEPGRLNIRETDGQLAYEWQHLLRKLKKRDIERYAEQKKVIAPIPHPLFRIIPGEIREWEKV